MCTVLSFIYVQVSDPKTEQASKDEWGKGKIRVVIDWPNGAGIRRGKGYKLFFKWAKHFNPLAPELFFFLISAHSVYKM